MNAFPPVSVLTLVRGRQTHLDHLIAGLLAQNKQPEELVISYMQSEPPTVAPTLPFAVSLVHVDGDELPLARARNSAAEAANSEVLAFLDVDCIPDPEFIRRSQEAASANDRGVFLPEVRYLPSEPSGWLTNSGLPEFTVLDWKSQRHPSKPNLSNVDIEAINDFGELWGLAFILRKATWENAGGMDEDYLGYGAEETDFSYRLQKSGAALYWLGGTVCYHQHHAVHKPPLQYFDSIVRNARLFRKKWGKWCMTYWLDEFERRGLVEREHDELRIIRPPSQTEIASSQQGPDVRFS